MSAIPAISVIIPLYNKADYIQRAVCCALSQTIEPLEVLVVDDGSTDGGPERLNLFANDPRVRIVRQKNAGEGAARNRGLAEMRGEIAAFLDADDEWLPGHLFAIAKLAGRFPEAGLLATGFRTVYRGLAVDTTLSVPGPTLIRNYFDVARGTFFIHISSAAVRRNVSAEVGGFVEGQPVGADLEFFARVALRYPIAYAPAISGLYYASVHGSAINTQKWTSQLPPAVHLLRAPESQAHIRPDMEPAVGRYANWLLSEYALTGLCAGKRTETMPILDEIRPQYAPGAFYRKALRVAAERLPVCIARVLIRLGRSRWAVLQTRFRRSLVKQVVRFGADPVLVSQ